MDTNITITNITAINDIISIDFINFIKQSENANKIGYNKKYNRWYPHIAPEGGYNIGYGHKILKKELKYYKNGISNTEIELLLIKELNNAKKYVIKYHEEWVNNYINNNNMTTNKFKLNKDDLIFKLSNKQLEMLIDFVYSIGSLNKFPKFTNAVFRKDWIIAEKECIRYYTNINDKKVRLLKRKNEMFKERYFGK